jgi:hypothetical protein
MLKKLLILSLFFVVSCQTTQPRVQANRTIFHNLNFENNKKLFIVGYPPEINQTLEFISYKKIFEDKFLNLGFTVTDNQNTSDLTAYISYGIDDGKTSTQVGSLPIFGSTGGGTSYHSGSVSSGTSFGNYSGTSYTMPTFGVVGSSTYSYNVTVYNRNLAMDILDSNTIKNKNPNKVFEGRIKSKGCSSQINEVMPALVDAMFKEFPGVNGKSEIIVIPIKVSSCQK